MQNFVARDMEASLGTDPGGGLRLGGRCGRAPDGRGVSGILWSSVGHLPEKAAMLFPLKFIAQAAS